MTLNDFITDPLDELMEPAVLPSLWSGAHSAQTVQLHQQHSLTAKLKRSLEFVDASLEGFPLAHGSDASESLQKVFHFLFQDIVPLHERSGS